MKYHILNLGLLKNIRGHTLEIIPTCIAIVKNLPGGETVQSLNLENENIKWNMVQKKWKSYRRND